MAKLNTAYELETNDGGKLKLTLAYRYLYQLRGKHRDQYNEFNEIMTKGVKDFFDSVAILYTAYLCELMAEDGDTAGCMSYDDFMDVLPEMGEVQKAVGMLIAPKKTMASASLS